MDIGDRLKKARESIGYTQVKAAEKSRIGVSSISEFENSVREPSFSQLSKLAEIYRKTIEFFFAENIPADGMMLWRDEPGTEESRKETEAKFYQLCEQYHRLELCTDEIKKHAKLPEPDVTKPEDFDYKQADSLAQRVQREFLLGDIPSSSLKHTLEEKFYVKIFYLSFKGGAISTVSDIFGPAILLRKDSKFWRRNFDLAHELFHILTWKIFRSGNSQINIPSKCEEKLANAFASRLLLPTDSVKERIEAEVDENGNVTFEALDEIAREFGVSLDALLWRLVYLYNKQSEEIEKHLEKAKEFKMLRPKRLSDEPDKLPERYCSLAIRALREGKLSLIQFSKYMGISYRKAQEYLTEDEGFKDEKVSISVA